MFGPSSTSPQTAMMRTKRPHEPRAVPVIPRGRRVNAVCTGDAISGPRHCRRMRVFATSTRHQKTVTRQTRPGQRRAHKWGRRHAKRSHTDPRPPTCGPDHSHCEGAAHRVRPLPGHRRGCLLACGRPLTSPRDCKRPEVRQWSGSRCFRRQRRPVATVVWGPVRCGPDPAARTPSRRRRSDS